MSIYSASQLTATTLSTILALLFLLTLLGWLVAAKGFEGQGRASIVRGIGFLALVFYGYSALYHAFFIGRIDHWHRFLRSGVCYGWYLLFFGALAWFGWRAFARAAEKLLVLLSPLILIVWLPLAKPRQSLADTAPAVLVKGSDHPVYVLVFDELDQALALESSEHESVCREFRRWRTWSCSSTQAYPPAGQTVLSIAGMLNGASYLTTQPHAINALKLVGPNGIEQVWSGSPSLFSDLREAGKTSAILGWFFPYRMFAAPGNTSVTWIPNRADVLPLDLGQGWWATLLTHITTSLDPGVNRTFLGAERLWRIHEAEVETFKARLRDLLTAPPADVTWIHVPIPHGPFRPGPGGGYRLNLQEADSILRMFREALQAGGSWDRASILVTADHWMRLPGTSELAALADTPGRWSQKDHRIPFLLKLPGQTSGTDLHGPLNTVVVRSLVLDLALARVRNPDQVEIWLHHRGPMGESPSTLNLP